MKWLETLAPEVRSATFNTLKIFRHQVCVVFAWDRSGSFQDGHLETDTTWASDDQILLQLGSYTTQDGDHREEFISGLRSLLADLRDRKIKDFATIGQAIVDFRSQFRQDKSKILPLGNISI